MNGSLINYVGIKLEWTLQKYVHEASQKYFIFMSNWSLKNNSKVSLLNAPTWRSFLSMMMSAVYNFALFLPNAFESWMDATNQFCFLVKFCGGVALYGYACHVSLILKEKKAWFLTWKFPYVVLQMVEGCPPFSPKQESEVPKAYAANQRPPFRATQKLYPHGLKE